MGRHAVLLSQLREAKLPWSRIRSPHICRLERRYETHLRHSRNHFAQHKMVDLLAAQNQPAQILAGSTTVLLPKELQDPVA